MLFPQRAANDGNNVTVRWALPADECQEGINASLER